VIAYLLPRMERSFAAAAAIVARLDAAALARKASITLRLAAEVLDSGIADGEDARLPNASP
jgi:chromosomal replication initiation ATPase DnaA